MFQLQHHASDSERLFDLAHRPGTFLKRIDISRIDWQDQFDAMEDDVDGEGDMNSYYTEFYV